MAENSLNSLSNEIEEAFHHKGFKHLKTCVKGKSIIVYSEYHGEKDNRCQFTMEAKNMFILVMADHLGNWEPTPYSGTIEELMVLLIHQFGWVLTDFK